MKDNGSDTSDTPKRFCISETSPESHALVLALKDRPPGSLVTYAELNAVVGADVQRDKRYWLVSARKRLLLQHGQRWDSVTREGVKHLTDVDVANVSRREVERIRRHAGRAIKQSTLPIKDYAALPQEAQVQQQTALSLLTLAYRATAPRMIQKVEAAVQKANSALPVARLLEIFG